MKRVKEMTIGEGIDYWLKGMSRFTQVSRARVLNQWSDYVGAMAARHTTHKKFEGSVLVITVDSAVVRRELELIKDPLIERINQGADNEVVTDIRFNS
ncbi:MAG: DUF721 domain-containing protein [Salinivirgaceae bacterium]|jgi:predicted nucleic acid-binding Zn ribbon protein|nr:DUF721 domain-containing protein [Salinivirgaceae bacterium]